MSQEAKKPLVSVIMPTYNHAQYIGEAISSVLFQTYKNLELIIVDNYSIDDTAIVIATFQDNRIKYFRFHNNGVIASSRNYGVKQASGDIIAFIDSDDVWVDYKLEIQIEHLQNKDICAVASDFIPIGDIIYCRKHLFFKKKEYFRDYFYKDIVYANPVMTSSLIMEKRIFIEDGGFDESTDYRFIEDWEFWLRVSINGKIRVLANQLIKYRVHKVKNRDVRDVNTRKVKILDKQFSLGYLNSKLLKYAKGNCYISIGKAFLDINDRLGIKFYILGVVCSRGINNKFKSLAGLSLFYIPKKFREKLIDKFYCWQAKSITINSKGDYNE